MPQHCAAVTRFALSSNDAPQRRESTGDAGSDAGRMQAKKHAYRECLSIGLTTIRPLERGVAASMHAHGAGSNRTDSQKLPAIKALADSSRGNGAGVCRCYRTRWGAYELRRRKRGRKRGIAASVARSGEAAAAGQALQPADRAGLRGLDKALHSAPMANAIHARWEQSRSSASCRGLATETNVAARTQNQALSALLFLYREVLGIDLPWMESVVRAKRPQRMPVVLSREEVAAAAGDAGRARRG